MKQTSLVFCNLNYDKAISAGLHLHFRLNGICIVVAELIPIECH